MRIRDRLHNTAHRQAIEIIIDKDQDTKQNGCKHGTASGLDMTRSPGTESSRAAGHVDQGNQCAEDHKEYKQSRMIRNCGHQTVI